MASSYIYIKDIKFWRERSKNVGNWWAATSQSRHMWRIGAINFADNIIENVITITIQRDQVLTSDLDHQSGLNSVWKKGQMKGNTFMIAVSYILSHHGSNIYAIRKKQGLVCAFLWVGLKTCSVKLKALVMLMKSEAALQKVSSTSGLKPPTYISSLVGGSTKLATKLQMPSFSSIVSFSKTLNLQCL